MKTAIKMTTIRLDTKLADEAIKIFNAKNRSEVIHLALREIIALKKFKNLMKRNKGKLQFTGYDK